MVRREQNFILFLEETEEEYFISNKLAKLYVNRFLVDEDAQHELLYSGHLCKNSSRLFQNYDPEYLKSEDDRNFKTSSDHNHIAEALLIAKQKFSLKNLHLVFGSSFYTIKFHHHIQKWAAVWINNIGLSSITLTLLDGKRFYLVSKEKTLDAYQGRIGIERESIIPTVSGLLVTTESGLVDISNFLPISGETIRMTTVGDSYLDDLFPANDDFELEFQKSLQDTTSVLHTVGSNLDAKKVLFLTPMLSRAEMKAISSENASYMQKFCQYTPIQKHIYGDVNNPDAASAEMAKSESDTKFVLCICNRRTIHLTPMASSKKCSPLLSKRPWRGLF